RHDTPALVRLTCARPAVHHCDPDVRALLARPQGRVLGAAVMAQEELPVQSQGGKPPADRLLAVVRQEAIQKMQRVPEDKINVWPHLIAAEFVSLLLMSALLFLGSGLGVADAAFRGDADPTLDPTPSH